MPRELVVGPDVINDESDCYVIAEIGHNHQGDLEKAKQLFRMAKEAGASAVKLQKRDNRSLFTREAFDKPYENENSFGPTYGLHREALEFGWDEYVELGRYAGELGITFFSTAFDFASADFLAEVGTPAFKMASADITNIPLLKYVAQFQRPMFVSTGAASQEDVDRAYNAIRPINSQFCILQCTASYPAEFEDLDLKVIETYRERYPDTVIGLSSHDNGIAMALVAYTLGARVVEKHFTLNRAMKGTDHAFSLEPVGLRKIVRDLRRARVAMGDGIKKMHENEQAALLKMGKKLVAAQDLPAGHLLTARDIAIKSPGDGLPPYELDRILGRTLRRAVRADESLTTGILEPEQAGAIAHAPA
jgi:N-acetylneuraminate synthase/sialic acid synthase